MKNCLTWQNKKFSHTKKDYEKSHQKIQTNPFYDLSISIGNLCKSYILISTQNIL